MTMHSEGLDHSLRPYLSLFINLLLQSPVQRNSLTIPYEEVVSALERDTIRITSGIGLNSNSSSFACSYFFSNVMLKIQIEPKKYETVVASIHELFHSSVFTAERVRIVASKMLNGITRVKTDGYFIASSILRFMFYSESSNIKTFSILNHQKFLTDLLEKLKDPDQLTRILKDLDTVREFLTDRENLTLHIATNISDRVKDSLNLSKVWGKFCQKDDEHFQNALRVTPDWKQIDYNGFGLKDGDNGTVVGMGSVESAFLYHAVESINDYLSPDLPALMLTLQYLGQTEGPLFKEIRGQGLAYGFNISSSPNEGLLILHLFRASNVIAAFKEAKRIVETHLQDCSWDENLLECARSSLISKIVAKERTIPGKVAQGVAFSFKQVPSNYNQMLVKQINTVTIPQLTDAGKKYISQLFSQAAKTAIVCNPAKVKEVAEGFATMNITLSVASSLDDSILNY